MPKKEEITPMMKQFFDLKAKHPDALLLFRCGDFYETYADDAVIASDILGITLTKRSSALGTRADAAIAMAGFPHHALDTYLPKLIRAGKRVAICDQLEDPKLTKKLVKRGITELVTPGVAMSDTVLNHKENNFLAAVHFGKSACGVSFLDISTGEFLVAEGTTDYVDKLLTNFSPKEILFERGRKPMFEGNFGGKYFTFEMDDWVFVFDTLHLRNGRLGVCFRHSTPEAQTAFSGEEPEGIRCGSSEGWTCSSRSNPLLSGANATHAHPTHPKHFAHRRKQICSTRPLHRTLSRTCFVDERRWRFAPECHRQDRFANGRTHAASLDSFPSEGCEED